MKKIIVLMLIMLFAGAAIAAPFNANAKTKRIPAGTVISLKLLTPLTTSAANAGAEFSAILLNDQTAGNDIILPQGSLIRGNVQKIVAAKRLSRGAILYLDFDHIVTPNGRQLPVSLSITGRMDLTYDGGLTTTRGYGDAMKLDWEKTKDIVSDAIEWGSDTGGTILVPFAAIGGGIGGGAYYAYSSVADLIKKGKNVYIHAGEVINVILTEPVDVPVI
ncbi:MAG: hypothetical protein LBJ74_01255 [Heliobacteriaceae bacterium]|jgi:hypothetical protein|nr:hypothetical protein [Heliobacteriaceae bacterium]